MLIVSIFLLLTLDISTQQCSITLFRASVINTPVFFVGRIVIGLYGQVVPKTVGMFCSPESFSISGSYVLYYWHVRIIWIVNLNIEISNTVGMFSINFNSFCTITCLNVVTSV